VRVVCAGQRRLDGSKWRVWDFLMTRENKKAVISDGFLAAFKRIFEAFYKWWS
jgi:hypothetical protein